MAVPSGDYTWKLAEPKPPSQTERGIAYGGKPLWQRSPRVVQPGKARLARRAGGLDGIQQGGTQVRNAETVLNVIRERPQRGPLRTAIGAALREPGTVPARPTGSLDRQTRDDQGNQRETVHGSCRLAKTTRIIADPALRAAPVELAGASRASTMTKPNGRTRALGIPTDRTSWARGHPDDSGSLLRAAVFRPLPRFLSSKGVTPPSKRDQHWMSAGSQRAIVKGCLDNIGTTEVLLSGSSRSFTTTDSYACSSTY